MDYIQYGCGAHAPITWKNFDSSPTLLIQKIPFVGRIIIKNRVSFPKNVEYGDIVKGLPILENTCKGIYCSHVLEHLSLFDFRKALLNTYRMLSEGGIFRLVIPDLEILAKRYINNPNPDAAIIFMQDTSMGKENRKRGIKHFFIEWLGSTSHLWMWDFKSLSKELRDMGFVDIRKAKFGDSIDSRFKEVEEKDRWNEFCFGIECKK